MRSVQPQGGRLDRASGRRTRKMRRLRSDEGVALVEMAIVTPLLFLLIFGMIDFGWLFFKNLDTRHAARETARLAAVAFGSNTADIVAEACTRIEGDEADIVIDFQGTSVGGELVVTVQQPYQTLTGFSDVYIPVDELKSTVATRLEQPITSAYSDEADETGYPDC